MALRVHREVKHTDNANAAFNLIVKDYMACVRKLVVAGAQVLNAAPHVGHFSELSKAVRQPEKVVVSLTFAELAM